MKTPLRRELSGTAAFGLLVIAIFLAGGVAWSMKAPLSGAVIAAGVVSFEGQRKTVQHLEGGIVQKILVAEGDGVAQGEALIVLDDTKARASVEELVSQIRVLAGEEARLRAERGGQAAIAFDHPLLGDAGSPDVAAILGHQRQLFQARAESLATRRQILLKRIDELGRQKEGLHKQLVGVRERLRLVREERETIADLLAKGYARRPRLLAAQRAEAELAGSEGSLIAALAQTRESIGESEFRIAGLKADWMEAVDGRLAEVHGERLRAEKLYREALDRLQRTRILAPVDGVVLDLHVKTQGGVIHPGEPVLDIAPVQDDLFIDARVRPIDIEDIVAGSEATLVFPAYSARHVKRVRGEVAHVSADSFKDEATGEPYFAARVKIDRGHLEAVAPELKLSAGMPAEVFFLTAERTLYDFLAEPVRRTFARALRES